MANTETANAQRYATQAQVAAAQAKIYADQSQEASGFASAAQESAEQSSASATSAADSALTASSSASSSAASATAAANSATSASASAVSAAEFGDNKLTFADTTSGLAGTTNGQYFRVPQGVGNVLAFRYYKNNSGVAQEVAEYPGQGAISNSIRQYATLSAAQSDVAAGNILNGSYCWVRNSADNIISDEYVNASGTLTLTGRKTSSQVEPNLALSLGVKTTALMTYSGELFNGSVGWDGAEVVSGARYGGWKAPAGQTGFNTYVFAQLILSTSELAFLTGKTVNFIIDITHSSNLSGKLSDASVFIPMLRINGVDITNIPLNIISISDTNTIVVFERQITSTDSSVMLAMRYRNTTTLASDVTFYNRTAYYRLQDPNGFKTELSDFNKRQFVPPVNNLAYLSPKSAEALGGATLDSTTATITIPSGQNGYNAYMGAFQRVHNNRTRAGETIRLVSKYTCSGGFLRTLTATQIGMLAQRNGVQSSGVQVTGSEKLISIDETSFMIMADYVVVGTASELVSVYFQVKDNTFTGASRSFQLTSTEFFFISDGEAEGDIPRAIKNRVVTTGSLISRFSSVSGEALNGAVLDVANYTITTPSGVSSYNAYMLFFLTYPGITKYVGSTVRFTMFFETSADVSNETTPTVNVRVITPSGTTNYAAAFNNVTKLTSTLMKGEVTYSILGTETTFAPFIQLKSTTVRTSSGYFKLIDLRADLLDVVSVGDTLGDQMASLREGALKSDIISALSGSATYSATYTVKADGTGDYSTLKAAITAHGGGTSNNARILYAVYEGIYAETNIVIPKYADVIGIGQRENIWFKGELPDNVDPTQIPLTQTFWMNDTSKIRNLKVTARNLRYPIHSDSLAYPDTSIKNAILDVQLCHIEHYGNAGAQAYQSSISSGVTVWSSCHAWGCGLHSGETINSEFTDYFSPTTPYYFHTNGDFESPCQLTIKGGTLRNKDPNGISAIGIQNLGAGQVGRLDVHGVTIQGLLSVDNNTWRAVKLVDQWGNRNSEMQVYFHSCSPVAVRSSNDSRVLQLISIDSSSSAVSISGTAVPALFGYNPVVIAGGSGYPARVLSAHSVKGEVTGGLIGQRLGDCTTTNKTLTVTFDGGSPVTLTLSANYTAMDNATVVAALNTLLNDSSGRGFSVITPYNNSAPVYQSDRERVVTNTSSVVILQGTAVAYNGGKLNGRRATNSDARSSLVGIALENIPPGAQGRVQSSGYLHTTYVSFTGTPPTMFLATCSVNSDATLSSGSSNPLLQRVATEVYEII